ncbi:MAG: lipoprotein [Proteobacteria bacterium]|nr:lipoprotein [Pseudomonadota bacterium]
MRWLLLIALISLVVTCGQKGPLTLPDKSLVSLVSDRSSQHADDHHGR